MNLSDKILEKLQSTPNKPGCYLMRDIDGKIIYIGKAKELSGCSFILDQVVIEILIQRIGV